MQLVCFVNIDIIVLLRYSTVNAHQCSNAVLNVATSLSVNKHNNYIRCMCLACDSLHYNTVGLHMTHYLISDPVILFAWSVCQNDIVLLVKVYTKMILILKIIIILIL